MGPDAVVLGASGHAKVVIATLRAAGRRVVAAFDDDPAKCGQAVLGVLIEGNLQSALARPDVDAILAIGGNRTRQALAGRLAALRWTTAVHAWTSLDISVQLGAGVVVFAGAVIQPDTRIGAHAIVNTGATVDHDCEIGPFCHLGPGSHLAGHVRVGAGVFVGTGAAVIPGVTIGDWATVGAGAAVIRDVPAGAVVGGVPARILGEHAS